MDTSSIEFFAVVVGLLLNFGGGIWWASKLNTTVSNLQEAVEKLEIKLNGLPQKYENLAQRVEELHEDHKEIERRLGMLEVRANRV